MFLRFMCVIKGTEANDTKKTAEIIKDENYEKRFLCVVSNLSAAEDIGKAKREKLFFLVRIDIKYRVCYRPQREKKNVFLIFI